MVATLELVRRPPLERARGLGRGEGGFTLVEFMISALIMTTVLGATVALATQVQQAYQTQLDDAAAEQEARYALEWIARDLRSAGSDPYNIILEAEEIWIDPNGGADPDSIRLQSDIFPPDGTLDDDGENITIAFDPLNSVITRTDANADDPSAIRMTEAIFTGLAFTFLNDAGAVEADSTLVTSVRVEVTAQSRGFSATIADFTSLTLSTDVRLRVR